MFGDGGELELVPARPQFARPHFDYAARNGWVAYTRLGGQSLQVWVRSPAGVNTQVTFFGATSRIDTLGPARQGDAHGGP